MKRAFAICFVGLAACAVDSTPVAPPTYVGIAFLDGGIDGFHSHDLTYPTFTVANFDALASVQAVRRERR